MNPVRRVHQEDYQPADVVFANLRLHGCQDIRSVLNRGILDTQPLARGGYGAVYFGTLRDGTPVAIKIIEPSFHENQVEEVDKTFKVSIHSYLVDLVVCSDHV
jgi:predicted unusual protein kinase regulating ubiquinone biosynthesis (AarF/ABC1/UbiB family)